MKKINKDNLLNFINYYHGFHDSYITNINYNINNEMLEMYVDVCWSGEPKVNDDGFYETNKTKLKMIFNKVYKINIEEIFSFDYVNNIYFKYITLDDKERICFATDNE